MNHVFLSGTVDSAPVLLSLPEQTPHVIMDLIITHRTAAGIEKKERYPISAWHGIATRAMELIRPGAHVSIKGYLSQKQTINGVMIEVTAEEFHSTMPVIYTRPIRRTMAEQTNSKVAIASVQNHPTSVQDQSSESVEEVATM